MKVRVFLFAVFVVTMIALASLLTIVTNTSPTTKEVLVVFYGSFFLVLAGSLFSISYGSIFYRTKMIPTWHQTVSSLRLSAIICAITTLSLALKAHGLLNGAWFLVLLVVGGITELVLRRRSFAKS